MTEETIQEPKKRGFASLSPEEHKRICSLGGKMAHVRGTAHKWTAKEAQEAGRKGGSVTSADRAHMSEIGKRGRRKSLKD